MEAASPPTQAPEIAHKSGAGALVLAVVALIALAGVGYVGYERFYARPVVQPVAGTQVTVRRGTVAAVVSATGSVVASRQSKLTMQSAGRLKEIPVKLGDDVKTGTVLARLDVAPLELKLAQARSALRTSQLKLEQIKAGARAEDVAQAEAAVQGAQGKLTDLQAGPLPQDVAQAQAVAESSLAAVRAAQAKLDQVRQGAPATDITVAEQAVNNAQAALQKAQIDLDKTKAGTSPEDIRQQELAVEQAKNTLWSQQVNRDAVCGRGAGGPCDSAKAAVAAAESGVTQARVKLTALTNKPDPKDVQTAQVAVDNARESLRSAQTKIEQIKGGPTAEEVRQAQAALEGAQATYQANLARVESLRQGAKPGEIQSAQAAVASAQQALALKRTPATSQDIALADEQVRAAELGVQQAQLDLENAVLTAPFDGTIGAVTANVGEQVAIGSPILTLVDPKAIRVDVSVDETDIARIGAGKAVQLTFDALPDKRFKGKVVGIAPNATVQQGVATYTVSISIDDADVVVQPGMTATASVLVAEKSDVIVVPNRAIRRIGRNQIVDVLVGDKTESRQIKTGLGNDQMTEIVDGLKDGETVVIPITTTLSPRLGGVTPAVPPPTNPANPAARPSTK